MSVSGPDAASGRAARDIFLGGLAGNVTEADITRFIGRIGLGVESVRLNRNPRGNVRFGFATLWSAADAQRAVAALNGRALAGRAVTVGPATARQTTPRPEHHARPEASLWIGNLAATATRNDVWTLVEDAGGEVEDVRVVQTGAIACAFVELHNPAAVLDLIAKAQREARPRSPPQG